MKKKATKAPAKKAAKKKATPSTRISRKPGTGKKQKTAPTAKRKAPARKRDRLRAAGKPTEKGKTGRPKLPKAKLELVCLAVMQGANVTGACRAFGVSPVSVKKYKQIAADQIAAGVSDSHEIDFVIALEEAEAHCIDKLRNRIFDHSRFDWRAAAWMLEGLEPEVWRKNAAVSITRNNGSQAGENPGEPGTPSTDAVTIIVNVTEPVDVENPPFK